LIIRIKFIAVAVNIIRFPEAFFIAAMLEIFQQALIKKYEENPLP
jgi:hypothetical protein